MSTSIPLQQHPPFLDSSGDVRSATFLRYDAGEFAGMEEAELDSTLWRQLPRDVLRRNSAPVARRKNPIWKFHVRKPTGHLKKVDVPAEISKVGIRNAFNIVSLEIFLELYAATSSLNLVFPFVRFFYARRFPLYFFMRVCSHEDEVNLFSSELDTCQGDTLGVSLWVVLFLL
ncbi:hypothetical protein R1flu_001090 [Riccia fluitans]|uniref:Uncharacterized protein n=1 Tax=Riccia fluitans TaxID=41844 RepID=A0ABD1Y2Q5_9MARC